MGYTNKGGHLPYAMVIQRKNKPEQIRKQVGEYMNYEHLCTGCMSELKTVGVCPVCGWDGRPYDVPHYLAQRTVLNGRYYIGKVLGHGGFGITYIAWDMVLNMKVAVKEYFPMGFAARSTKEPSVNVHTKDFVEQFDIGLEKFLEEARLLARFSEQPGIVSVRDFFKANDTAYMVMNYLEGCTLEKYLLQNEGRLSWNEALKLIAPVIDALSLVHGVGVLHRDISPGNIFITNSGQVKIIDFGASRYAIGEANKSLSVILKRGYAPEEQYRSKGNQWPWTDVYALAATIYRMVTGEAPIEALDRVIDDSLKRPSQLGIEVPKEFDTVLMRALSVRPQNRYQDMKSFKEALASIEGSTITNTETVSISTVTLDSANAMITDSTELVNKPKQRKFPKRILMAIFLLAVGVIGTFLIVDICMDEDIVERQEVFNSENENNDELMPEEEAATSEEETQDETTKKDEQEDTAQIPEETEEVKPLPAINLDGVVLGNSTGNITQLGYTAVNQDSVYYVNHRDASRIYKAQLDGSNSVCLDSESTLVKYINVINGKVYYTAEWKEDGNTTIGIVKINTDGTKREVLMKPEDNYAFGELANMLVQNDWIYFLQNDPRDDLFTLYKMKTNGTELTKIIDDPVTEFIVLGDWIFYVDYSGKYLIRMRNDGTEKTTIKEGNYISNLIAEDGWLYYNDVVINQIIQRIRFDGSEHEKVSGTTVDNFNISGEWIYFTIQDDYLLTNTKIYKMKTDGTEKTLLVEAGGYTINIAGDWIYFDEYSDDFNLTFNRIKTDGTGFEEVQ